MFSWKRKVEAEEFSQNLGFNHPEVLKYRQFQATLRGPGSYDLPSDFDGKPKASTYDNVSFGVEKRFKSFIKKDYPPPGTYTKLLNKPQPCYCREFSKRPTFERDGFIDRFRGRTPNYLKPPNLYDPTPITSDKIISRRGPYDCFTGPRDGSTIKNYFAPSAFKPPDHFYKIPSHLEYLLEHPSKRQAGKFLKALRLPNNFSVKVVKQFSICTRDPDYPGPGYYNLIPKIEEKKGSDKDDEDQPKPQSRCAFFSSVLYARPLAQWKIHPGPGRYKPKSIKCQKMEKPSWMFLSTSERNIYTIIEYNAF